MTSQHDKAKRWQFGLRDLLLVIGIAAVLFAIMPLNPWLGFIWLATIGSSCGIRFAWMRHQGGAYEAFLGGIVGGAMGLVVTSIPLYASGETGEISFVEFVWTFLPTAIVVGAIIGVSIWLVAAGLRAIRRIGCSTP